MRLDDPLRERLADAVPDLGGRGGAGRADEELVLQVDVVPGIADGLNDERGWCYWLHGTGLPTYYTTWTIAAWMLASTSSIPALQAEALRRT